MMKPKLLAVLAAASAFAVACGGGQETPETPDDANEGPMESTGEEMDEAGEDVGEGVDEGLDETGEEIEEAGDEIDEEM